MRLGTQIKKLHKKLKRNKKLAQYVYNSELFTFTIPKKLTSKNEKLEDLKKKIDFLKHLLSLINKGASGFELAYEVEKNQEIKNLIYDGILFYNTFIEIGNTRFLDAPDKVKLDYRSFKTIEDTEKSIFMMWLKETINSLERKLLPKDEYEKFLETKKTQEIKESIEKLRERITHCKNCGARILSKEQVVCEECGEDLTKNILKIQ